MKRTAYVALITERTPIEALNQSVIVFQKEKPQRYIKVQMRVVECQTGRKEETTKLERVKGAVRELLKVLAN